MNKKIAKKLTLQDFLMPTLSNEPSRLFLIKDGKDTAEYLEVVSGAHSKLKRAKMKWGMEHNKIVTASREIEDEVDKNVYYTEEKLNSDTDYALEIVVGWSLGEFDVQLLEALLRDNQTLVDAIIAHSHNNENYAEKK